ncbi:MAG: hypothetical protein JKY03_13930 [Aureispira sp.]|nr:hypothetical protein [Aureispira sp.]
MKATLKKNKSVLIAGLVLIALILAYFKRDSIKEFFSKSKPEKALNVPSPNTSAAPTPTVSNNNTVLKKGSSGVKVRELQVLMNTAILKVNPNYLTLATDSNFGAKTEDRLFLLTGVKIISINQFKSYT